jgi:addiction module RelE/StbE family toxin
MAYNVKVSDSADKDLDEIFTYIAEKLANPKVAADFARELEERYTALEIHPLMFELSRDKRLAAKGYRRFVVGSYIALYLVDEKRREITIARVFYGRREYEKYL